jgi:hypothetical protein
VAIATTHVSSSKKQRDMSDVQFTALERACSPFGPFPRTRYVRAMYVDAVIACGTRESARPRGNGLFSASGRLNSEAASRGVPCLVVNRKRPGAY